MALLQNGDGFHVVLSHASKPRLPSAFLRFPSCGVLVATGKCSLFGSQAANINFTYRHRFRSNESESENVYYCG
jgi:hypothetical protein